jgi:hypothetical protein
MVPFHRKQVAANGETKASMALSSLHVKASLKKKIGDQTAPQSLRYPMSNQIDSRSHHEGRRRQRKKHLENSKSAQGVYR